jgi:hypothetical protein
MTKSTFVGLITLASTAPFTAVLLHIVFHDYFGVEDRAIHDSALLIAAFLDGILFGRIALEALGCWWLNRTPR